MSAGFRPPARTRVALAFGIVFLVWGSSYLATRIGVLNMPPFLFAGSRFLVAGTLMLGYALATGERIRLAPGEWRHVIVLALLGFFISNGINVWALQFVRSNVSALLNASVPCWIALLSAFGASSERPGARTLAGLMLGIAGTALVMRPAPGTGQAGVLPQVLILVGCLSWSTATLYQRRRASSLAVPTLIGWQMLLGGACLLLLGLATSETRHWHWTGSGVWLLLYLIVFASCLAHTSYAWLARHTSPNSIGTYAYVNPLIATLLGWLVLDEALVGRQLLGMVVVLTGVLLINWPAGLLAAATRRLRPTRTDRAPAAPPGP